MCQGVVCCECATHNFLKNLAHSNLVVSFPDGVFVSVPNSDSVLNFPDGDCFARVPDSDIVMIVRDSDFFMSVPDSVCVVSLPHTD